VCVCICLLAWLAGGVANIKCSGVVLYCTVPSGVTIEADAGMTDQFDPVHNPLNVCKVCVCMSDMLQLAL